MVRITKELLQKRAEHNDGMLSNLQEITLHQQGIEHIELIGHLCRNLKTLYLQNNLIGKLQNLHHLKELQYLNLAVNNITRIENLHRCESLQKLDLTMNFIPLAALPSLANMQPNYNLRELHLLGNPCTQWQGYRPYVIALLPQLQRLDSEGIMPEERRNAEESLHEWQEALKQDLLAEGTDLDQAADTNLHDDSEPDIPETGEMGEDGEMRRPWCAATRLLEHREMERLNREAEAAKAAAQSQILGRPADKRVFRENFPPLPEEGQSMAQKNEGKWDFTLQDSKDNSSLVLDVCLGMQLVTTEVRADVHPHLVRLLAKGKLLQLHLPEEVKADESFAQRSNVTGNLVVTMPKVVPGTCLDRLASARCKDGDVPILTAAGKGHATLSKQNKIGRKDTAKLTGSIQPAHISTAQPQWSAADDDCIPSLIAC